MKLGVTSIVIACYNTHYFQFHYTGNCLGNVRQYTPEKEREIIIIDNGSTFPQELLKKYSDKYFRFEENKGCSVAWNKGIEMAEGEYICILNNDVEVFEGWLTDLRAGLNLVDVIMSHPMYDDAYARATEAKSRREEWLSKPYDQSLGDFMDFSCFMFKKEVVDKIGGFDEKFMFGYGEDKDFQKRLEAEGMSFASTKLVNTLHIIGSTSYFLSSKELENKGVTSLSEVMNRNKEYLQEKWNKPTQQNLVRTIETGDQIYLLKDGKRHWVRNVETLRALGFELGQEREVDYNELEQFPEAESLNMAGAGEVAKSVGQATLESDHPSPVKPVLGYKETATMEDFDKYNES